MDKDEIIARVVKTIRSRLGEEYKIFLFGSWASGDALPESDIDIGILGREKVSWDVMVEILEAIEALPTLRKIDIVDLKTKEPSFKNYVLSYAKIL